MPSVAFILCGGLGLRLRSVNPGLAKVLAPIAHRPFLDYLLCYLRDQNISKVILGIGFGANQIRQFCQDGRRWNLHVIFSEESRPLGTGGALKHAEDLIRADLFWVLNGDSLVRVQLTELYSFHLERQAQITLALTQVHDRELHGSVQLTAENRVIRFQEKGEKGTGLINAGLYLMNRQVFDSIPSDRAVSLEHEVFPLYVNRGLYGKVFSEPFIDIGTPESYQAAQALANSECKH
jgi:NDP-sugar pyrophosphorylase family protein